MPTARPSKERILRTVALVINVVMVVSSYFLVINDLLVIALIVFAASKWRMFATRPRLWLLNIRNSLCDILFGLSVILLMNFYYEVEPRLTIALGAALFIWQIIIKPRASFAAIKLQSALCLAAGTTAIWTLYPQVANHGIVAVGFTLLTGYAAAFHVFRQLDEDTLPSVVRSKLIVLWLYIVGVFAWLSWLWNISYSLQVSVLQIPQITLWLSLTFYFIGGILFYSVSDPATGPSARTHAMRNIVAYGCLTALIVVLTEWNSSIQ